MPPRRIDRAAGVLLAAARAGDEAVAGHAPLYQAALTALSHLCDPHAMAQAARELGDDDEVAGDACVLWAAAIRAAVLDGSGAGPAADLDLLPATRRTHWSWWIEQAQQQQPAAFPHHGSVVPVMQAAWSAVWRTPVPADDPATGSFGCQQLAACLATEGLSPRVAAVAGTLLGARWGASAAPFEWLRSSYSGLGASELIRLGALTATGGRDDARGWPSLARRPLHPQRVDPAVPHPCDDGVLLGGLGARDADADAVVSLCQTGRCDFEHVPAGDHLQIWLVDNPGDNNQVAYVIDQAARAVAAFRAAGKRVFLHCHAGLSRAPSVAARYACLSYGLTPAEAFAAVADATGRPTELVNRELVAAVYELAGSRPPAAASPAADTWTRSRH
jgi:predicted protein tyrosine phosphatase